MATFRADAWAGNHWASIEVEPVDERLLEPLLDWLCGAYQRERPALTCIRESSLSDLICLADFAIGGSGVALHLDEWSLSLAFEHPPLRDEVLARLRALPPDYFPL